jgi:hypothetical protein
MIRHVTSVELAGKICGVSRGVAYEQRRLVVPVARLAETLGTTPEALSATLDALESGSKPASAPIHVQVV